MKYVYFFLCSLISITTIGQSRFLPESSTKPIANRSVVETVIATISYQGYDETQAYFGEGEYEIFIDNVDGVLDNPIIVLDGFDPGDARDITALYNSLIFDGQNMADILRDQGYDIIIFNNPLYTTGGKDIDGGADYIQRNAFVLAELISIINDQKVGDEELVVLGPSMGGLVGRYALAYMEQNSLPHETRLFISFDSPHRGANVPISLQYLINYLAFEFNNPEAQAIVAGVLNSPAAKEMLVDHLAAHLADGSDTDQDPTKLLPEGAPGFRDVFQAELDAMGFAQNVRNVAMINGSGIGTTTGTPGMQVIDTTLDIIAGTTAEVSLHFMPEAGQAITITDWKTFLGPVQVGSFSADGESFAFSDGVDSAPGGTANISTALGDGTNPVIVQFIEALDQDAYCFVPTLSALDIDEDDWYANPDLSASPFVNTHIPNVNEDHVTVTPEGAAFAIFEITGGILGVNDVAGISKYILSENPIGNTLRIAVDPSVQTSSLEMAIFNMAGQQVYNTGLIDVSGEIRVNHGLSSGLYILTLTDSQGTYSHKLVVE
ncbi:T9SS type A sorting domain-containing protein [Aureisphaera galaxeae]|uniref:T9SS type A sorting domain-containing protein n=1 Tax=Aureisphaera galaxeae TaxID=1538023 RepID=UPI002350AA43|nr:T9SS type A sorting domain-containing protein [Aureisphaera galaxeae]MDC8003731.1 T9SS type A sorting domain-containing protein [Aureisphaera galaxeae]